MPIDDRTTNRSYQLPNAGNLLVEDVARLRAALSAIDADIFARYTKTEVEALINGLIAGAPGALNTLDELAAALGDDANFAATVTNLLALKANIADVYSKAEADARYVQGQVQTEMVFIATANQSVFTLTTAVINKPSALVTVDGVVQPTSEYSLNMTGTQLTLSEGVPAGTIVRVLALGVSSEGAPADDTVTTVKLRDGAVTTQKLADGAVTTSKLADAALAASTSGRAKMADLFITTAKLADGVLSADATGRAKMADGFVTSSKIEDGTIVNADINTSAGIVDSKLTGTTCKAWVNFNGSGVVAIRASGNVSSITDNGVGDYTVNFTTALADANYAVITGATGAWATNNTARSIGISSTTAPTASAVRIVNIGTGTAEDTAYQQIAIFR